eukprot:6174066-Pleurochrysis_carterae.AAC.1
MASRRLDLHEKQFARDRQTRTRAPAEGAARLREGRVSERRRSTLICRRVRAALSLLCDQQSFPYYK